MARLIIIVPQDKRKPKKKNNFFKKYDLPDVDRELDYQQMLSNPLDY